MVRDPEGNLPRRVFGTVHIASQAFSFNCRAEGGYLAPGEVDSPDGGGVAKCQLCEIVITGFAIESRQELVTVEVASDASPSTTTIGPIIVNFTSACGVADVAVVVGG
jgi:hypothetical protein